MIAGFFGGDAFWGAYVFAEKEFFKKKLDFMPALNCGTCEPNCKPEEGTVHWGAGISPFPYIIKPNESIRWKNAGIEVGFLLHPRSSCDVDLEVIALLDLTDWLPPPVGPAVKAGKEIARNLGKRFNLELECGAGIDISGSVHL